jgi:hypothetical protein
VLKVMKKKLVWLEVGAIVILIAIAVVAYIKDRRSHTNPPNLKPSTASIETPETVSPQPQVSPQPAPTYINPQPTYREPSTLMGRCPACHGRGYFNDPTICPVCSGAGKVIGVRVVAYVGGIPVYERDNVPTICSRCGGYGFRLPTYGRCETCGGRTTGDWIEYWKQQARQYWMVYNGGRYNEVNLTP